jgi:hypothetical protein
MTPLERAIKLLKDNGYRDAKQPFPIGASSFSFDAVLTIDRSLDLIILQDTTLGDADQLRRNVLAFSRSLDVIGSRRTLTVVLVGQSLEAETTDAISKVCRVLQAGTLTGERSEETLRDSLAVLLPLELPNAVEIHGDWRGEVLKLLPEYMERSANGYLNATEQSVAGVRAEFKKRVDRHSDPRETERM